MVKTVNNALGWRPSVTGIIATDWFTYVELKRSRMYSRNLVIH